MRVDVASNGSALFPERLKETLPRSQFCTLKRFPSTISFFIRTLGLARGIKAHRCAPVHVDAKILFLGAALTAILHRLPRLPPFSILFTSHGEVVPIRVDAGKNDHVYRVQRLHGRRLSCRVAFQESVERIHGSSSCDPLPAMGDGIKKDHWAWRATTAAAEADALDGHALKGSTNVHYLRMLRVTFRKTLHLSDHVFIGIKAVIEVGMLLSDLFHSCDVWELFGLLQGAEHHRDHLFQLRHLLPVHHIQNGFEARLSL
mmetsp:Transcript_24538/g.54624  ORF Transcript_24538/g.54624 Transcript_24538/m.54624 type:complete len:259 (+) Transcript_24538:604-1380(+)